MDIAKLKWYNKEKAENLLIIHKKTEYNSI